MRWMTLALLIACSSSPDAVGVASSPPGVDGGDLDGLFAGRGGSGGGSGSIVLLEDGGHVVAPGTEDAGVDAAVPVEVDLDAAVGDGGVVDAEADAGMAEINPQCRSCYDADSEFPECPEGYSCNYMQSSYFCLLITHTNTCPDNLTPLSNRCWPPGIFCSEWLEMYGNQ